jgi:hypothetical protein
VLGERVLKRFWKYEAGEKYVMKSFMIYKIIRVTKHKGLRCRGSVLMKLRTPDILRKSTIRSGFTTVSCWWLL